MVFRLTSDATGAADAANWSLTFQEDLYKTMSNAAYRALHDTAEDIKAGGRRSIASAGFSKKWQNAWRVKVYPEGQPSMRAAIQGRHAIPYAGIFEAGGRVSGRPLMWLPTKNVPVLGDRYLRKMTPTRFVERFGPLRSRRKSEGNKTPILFGKAPGSRKFVPMFIGIKQASHRRRFDIGGVFVAAVRNFESHYARRLAEEQAR